MLSLLAVFAVGAVASSSASALLWWVCLAGMGTTEYTNAECRTQQMGGGFVLQLLPLNMRLNIESKGVGNQVLKVPTLGGLEIVCTAVTDTGWIENNGAAMNGIDEAASIKYTGCTVVKPTGGCGVKTAGLAAGNITVSNVKTKLVTFTGGGIGDQFGETGTTFVALEIGKSENATTKKFTVACGTIPLAGQKVEGQVVAKVEASGKLDFTEPAQEGSNLKVAGQAATYIGEVEQYMETNKGLIEARNEV